jgi:CxxC motif-containing protein
VPKEKIPEVLEAIRITIPSAPVSIGQVIVPDVAKTGADIVATAACEARR